MSERAAGTNDDALAHQGVHRRIAVPHAHENKIGLALHVIESHLLKRQVERFSSLPNQSDGALPVVVVLERCQGRRLRELIHVERLANAVHVLDDALSAQGESHAKAGQAVDFRKRPQDDQRKAVDQRDAVGIRRVVCEIAIGLIQEHQEAFG